MLVAGSALARASFKFGVVDGLQFEAVISELANQEMSLDWLFKFFFADVCNIDPDGPSARLGRAEDNIRIFTEDEVGVQLVVPLLGFGRRSGLHFAPGPSQPLFGEVLRLEGHRFYAFRVVGEVVAK